MTDSYQVRCRLESPTLNKIRDRDFYGILEHTKRNESVESSDDESDQINTSDEEFDEIEEGSKSDLTGNNDVSAGDTYTAEKRAGFKINFEIVKAKSRYKEEDGVYTTYNGVNVYASKFLGLVYYNSPRSDAGRLTESTQERDQDKTHTRSFQRNNSLSKSENMLAGMSSDTEVTENFVRDGQSGCLDSSSISAYSCEVCKESFRSRLKLLHHLSQHCTVIRNGKCIAYKCDICTKVFIRNHSYHLHLSVHTGQRSYVCKYCGSLYYLNGSLTCHLRQQHGDAVNRRKCSYDRCRKTFSSAYFRRAHVALRICSSERFKCSVCSKTFFLKETLQRHEQFHVKSTGKEMKNIVTSGKNEAIAVKEAGKMMSWLEANFDVSSNNHESEDINRSSDSGERKICLGVTAEFQIKEKLECLETVGATKVPSFHVQKDALVLDNTKSETANSVLDGITATQTDVDRKGKERKMQPEYLAKIFQTETGASLNKNIPGDSGRDCGSNNGLKHSVENKLITDIHTKQSNSLKRRISAEERELIVKQNTREFKCVYCGIIFPTARRRKRHHRVDHNRPIQRRKRSKKTAGLHEVKPMGTQEDEFVCKVCDVSLKSKRFLYEHMCDVHNQQEMAFLCSICRKIYRTRKDLYNHVYYIHYHGHKCELCNKSFARKGALKMHMEKLHSS